MTGHDDTQRPNEETLAEWRADAALSMTHGHVPPLQGAEWVYAARILALLDALAAAEAERDHWKRVAGHVREQAEQQEDRAKRAEAERDDLRATEAVLRGEIRRAESALATFEDVNERREQAEARVAAVEGYVSAVSKIHAAYRNLVMDTPDDRALHARLIEVADRALSGARAALEAPR